MTTQADIARLVQSLDNARPVLIAGPTASGKSALALAIAEAGGGTVVNADALQVYDDWRILTARPGPEDMARAPHVLYGHIAGKDPYSVGDWLRDVRPHLAGGPRPIITGGTGLYFTALTEGLADIPETPAEVRSEADDRVSRHGVGALLAELDDETAARIDRKNPARIQRAWEVLRTTGTGLAHWQDRTGPPLLPLSEAQPILLDADREWLAARIARRFEAMLDDGVLDEARGNRPDWSPVQPSAKAIGAAELMAFLDGKIPLETVKERVNILTRQYAKRQRTWFRARMKGWRHLTLP